MVTVHTLLLVALRVVFSVFEIVIFFKIDDMFKEILFNFSKLKEPKGVNKVNTATNSELKGSARAADTIADVLRFLGASEITIINALERGDPALAEMIKEHIFFFESFAKLDDVAIQKVLGKVDQHTLGLALRNATDETFYKLARNMKTSELEDLRKHIADLGPVVPYLDIENAQKSIINTLKVLVENKEVSIAQEFFSQEPYN